MKHQQGATMIIVLVVLLLVAIAGTIALRSGVFGMRLSTNSQVAKLLSNNNDSALTKFEDMEPVDIQASFALGGVYNFLLDPANADNELIFCYNAKDPDTFSLSKAAIIKTDDTVDRVPNFCNAATFSSDRGIVITQVHMRKNTADDKVAEGYTTSTSVPTTANHINISMSTISVMPAFSNEDKTGATEIANINACLQRTAFKKTTSTTTNAECFIGLGIPHNVQNADFTAGNEIKTSK